jgi:hypothetical protein
MRQLIHPETACFGVRTGHQLLASCVKRERMSRSNAFASSFS